jgi:DNA polymerase
MPRIILDFETASPVDLKLCGAAVYAEHPLTEILCLVWRREGSNAFGVWAPLVEEYADLYSLDLLAGNPGTIFVSHASFEQFIWRAILVPLGLPELPPERWEDTQATAGWRSLPLQLEKLCKVLDLDVQKDMAGRRLTLGLSKPDKKTGMLDRSRPSLERVIEYCKADVAGEEATLHHIGDLSPAERKVWLLDQEINQRGVRLDMEFVRLAQLVVDRATIPLTEEFRDLTGGINPGQRGKIIEWCAGQGTELENLQKPYLAELLGTREEDDAYESLAGDGDDGPVSAPGVSLPMHVRRVLAIRQMLGSTSIKKLVRMRACVCADGRARGLLQYHAAHSGRWGGRLLQPQNFPRGTGLDPEIAVASILQGDPALVESSCGAAAIEVVGHSLRHALIPAEGYVFEVGDFAGIEMRVVLALAGQHDRCALLASGVDVYIDMANAIYNRTDITKANIAERTIGKNTVLGCGFQMGAPKFHGRYCKDQPFEFAEKVVDAYRETWAPKVPALWNAFKVAVTECVRYGKTVEVYGCTFRRSGDFMAIDLPSGWQTLWYYRPQMHVRDEYGPSPCYWAMKAGQWTRIYLYGGIICENIVQALARGILVEAMGRLNYREKRPVVLSVHDEAICEVPEGMADKAFFKAIMEETPAWVTKMGVPIEVEAWIGPRYRK